MSRPETEIAAIAARFDLPGPVREVERQGGGHINDSYRIAVRRPAGDVATFLLQRINASVFREPQLVMENVARVTLHLDGHMARPRHPQDASQRALSLVATRDRHAWLVDDTGAYWRLFHYIEGAYQVEEPRSIDQAREAARAFGRFQGLLADYSGPRLHDTIPHFHDTPRRLEHLERTIAADRAGRAAAVRAEIEALRDRRGRAGALLAPLRNGEIGERVVHNDAKIANVLFAHGSDRAVCVVDLDTVMPGLAVYDFGDMARSMLSGTAEDERDLERISVREHYFEALAGGFSEAAGEALSARERSLFVDAAVVLTYEQAVRFLDDHIDGDRYFRIHRPGHNLDRARTQLRLLECLEASEPRLRRITSRL